MKKIILILILLFNIQIVNAEELPVSAPEEIPVETPKEIIYTLILTEVYPSPDSSKGEKEWLEIYNYGNEQLDLKDLYFREKGTLNGYSNTKSKLPEVKLDSGKYLVIYDENLQISLNNGGDTITLFNHKDQILDSIIYESISSDHSAIRKFENNEYLTKYIDQPIKLEKTNIITANSENKPFYEEPEEKEEEVKTIQKPKTQNSKPKTKQIITKSSNPIKPSTLGTSISYELPSIEINYLENRTMTREIYLWPFFLIALLAVISTLLYSYRELLIIYIVRLREYIKSKHEEVINSTHLEPKYKELLEY